MPDEYEKNVVTVSVTAVYPEPVPMSVKTGDPLLKINFKYSFMKLDIWRKFLYHKNMAQSRKGIEEHRQSLQPRNMHMCQKDLNIT